jgi:ATP-dependent Clp protease ATP-binding subunit ClpA
MMIKRLSADARELVLRAATAEAHRRGDRRLGTDHLLLGLLGVDLATARAADDALDRTALAAVGIAVTPPPSEEAPGEEHGSLALTSSARAAFKRALDQARPVRTGRIETRHFLLAVLDCERPDPAAALLQHLGIDRAAVRARLAAEH